MRTTPRGFASPTCLALLLSAVLLAAAATADVPVSEGLRSLNGTELWVKRMGSGEPVVVVHGGPVLEHGYFLPHLAPLAEEYELIFFDQRMSGRSAPEVDESEVRMAAFVEDIEALRVELGLGKIHLMGHSWGGHLAMRYAIEHEQELASLVLLDPLAASSELWQAEQRRVAEEIPAELRAEAKAIRESEALKAFEPAAIEKLMRVTFASQFYDPAKAERLRFYVPSDYGPRSRRFAALAPELESYDLHEQLAALSVPTLVLFGESEPGAELGGAAIAEAMPGARLVLIPEAGHFPFIEQPEAFLDAVTSFLSAPSEAQGGVDSGFLDRPWRLLELGGEPVAAGDRQPHMVFVSAEKRASGFAGCNRFNGSFVAADERIAFGPIMSTRMSCEDADDLETAFLGALERVEAWRLESGRLELLDGAAEVLALFGPGAG